LTDIDSAVPDPAYLPGSCKRSEGENIRRPSLFPIASIEGGNFLVRNTGDIKNNPPVSHKDPRERGGTRLANNTAKKRKRKPVQGFLSRNRQSNPHTLPKFSGYKLSNECAISLAGSLGHDHPHDSAHIFGRNGAERRNHPIDESHGCFPRELHWEID
jgi:hypothetical protein